MSARRLLLQLAVGLAILAAMPVWTAAQGQSVGCLTAIINQTGSSDPAINAEYNRTLEMNHEGRTERSADFAVYSASAAQTCFIDGTTIHIVFPAVLTNAGGTSYGLNAAAAGPVLQGGVNLPYSPLGAGTPGAYYIVDPTGSLSVTVTATLVGTAGQGGFGTDLTIRISTGTAGTGGTAPTYLSNTEAYVVFQNLRWDVVNMNDGRTPAGQPFNNVLSASGTNIVHINPQGLSCLPSSYLCFDVSLFHPVLQVGTVRNTIFCSGPFSLNLSTVDPPDLVAAEGTGFSSFSDAACADVYRVGFGFENGVNPYIYTFPNGEENPGTGGPGNTSGQLIRDAIWYMTENPYWQYVNPFRIQLNPNRVPGDISTTPTDLLVDIEAIPLGVTFTLPQTLSICQGSAVGVQWKLAAGSPSTVTGNASGTTSLIAVYNTVLGDVYDPAPGNPLIVFTAPTASDVNCVTNTPANPTFGVAIADPSGIGNILLRVVMGPSEGPGTFAGDDVNPSAIPRYINAIVGTSSRGIIGSNGNPVRYIDIDPTRTYLLYSYVTDKTGWQAGIEVSNTGLDAQAFSPEGVNNKGQSGALDVWFFTAGVTPFKYTVQTGVGRGLDANGLLQPGSVWAATLDTLLTASGNTGLVGNFDGYLIIVCHFNFAHGAAYLFSAVNAATLSPALVLGGDSARSGNVRKLPERLVQ